MEKICAPDFDSGDIKGCFWHFGKPPVVFVLNVFFDPDGKAIDVDVRQFLGPESGAYVRHLEWKTLSCSSSFKEDRSGPGQNSRMDSTSIPIALLYKDWPGTGRAT
jgi:hypothetical protein